MALQDTSHYKETVVQVELSGPGEEHPNLWATKALSDDPAKRLAFRLTIRFEGQTPDTICYPTNGGDYAPYKANVFFDWMDGLTDERIIESPRRFLNIQPGVQTVPERLVYFRNGGYTDDSGR